MSFLLLVTVSRPDQALDFICTRSIVPPSGALKAPRDQLKTGTRKGDRCQSRLDFWEARHANNVQLHTFEAKPNPTANLPKMYDANASGGFGYRRIWIRAPDFRVREMSVP